MQIIHTINELTAWRNQQEKIAFVPTMGNLHAGHLALVKAAKEHAEHVVVSIFVNPLQFGQGEDYTSYPRTLQEDADKLIECGVDVLFAPNVDELYPHSTQDYCVEPPALQHELCGRFRPGHFRGVATVVLKLFNIVRPNFACFGKKDYQQLAIIQGMVADLNVPVEIIPVDTGRDIDGLALSSRNSYLTPQERASAPQLYKMLCWVRDELISGRRDFVTLETDAMMKLNKQGWQTDYIEIRDAKTLEKANENHHDIVILAASRLSNTRLIDNLEVHI